MSSSTAASGNSASMLSRNTSKLSATSSEGISIAFIKRALTPKATWTHKVKIFLFSTDHFISLFINSSRRNFLMLFIGFDKS